MDKKANQSLYRLKKLKKGAYYVCKGILPGGSKQMLKNALGIGMATAVPSVASMAVVGITIGMITGSAAMAFGATGGIGAAAGLSGAVSYQLIKNRKQLTQHFKMGKKGSENLSFEDYTKALVGDITSLDRKQLEKDTLAFYTRFGKNSPEVEQKMGQLIPALSTDNLLSLYVVNRFAERSMHLNLNGVDAEKLSKMTTKYTAENYQQKSKTISTLKLEIGRKLASVYEELATTERFLSELTNIHFMDVSKFQKYLQAGLNPNMTLPSGKPLLQEALEAKNLSLAKLLAKHGADIPAREGQLPAYMERLEASTKHAFVQFCEQQKHNEKLLQQALEKFSLSRDQRDWTAIGEIIIRGVNPNITDSQGNTATHLAAQSGNLGMLDFVLANRSAPNRSNLSGETPLHLAAKNGQLETLKLLIRKGANVNARNHREQTPIFYALLPTNDVSAAHKTIIAETLLNAQAALNVKDLTGNTPLHLACAGYQSGHPASEQVVSLLLQRGSNPIARNTEDALPLDKGKRPQEKIDLTALFLQNKDTLRRFHGKNVLKVLASYEKLYKSDIHHGRSSEMV